MARNEQVRWGLQVADNLYPMEGESTRDVPGRPTPAR
jgi:hypothetical protein